MTERGAGSTIEPWMRARRVNYSDLSTLQTNARRMSIGGVDGRNDRTARTVMSSYSISLLSNSVKSLAVYGHTLTSILTTDIHTSVLYDTGARTPRRRTVPSSRAFPPSHYIDIPIHLSTNCHRSVSTASCPSALSAPQPATSPAPRIPQLILDTSIPHPHPTSPTSLSYNPSPEHFKGHSNLQGKRHPRPHPAHPALQSRSPCQEGSFWGVYMMSLNWMRGDGGGVGVPFEKLVPTASELKAADNCMLTKVCSLCVFVCMYVCAFLLT